MNKSRFAILLAIVNLLAYKSLANTFETKQDIKTNSPLLWMKKSKEMLDKWSENNTIYFALNIHLSCVQRKNPEGKYERFFSRTIENIENDLIVLNKDFKPAHIQFYIKYVTISLNEIPYEKNNTIAHEALNIATRDGIITQIIGHPQKENSKKDSIEIYYRFNIGLGIDGLAEIHHSTDGCIWIHGPTNAKQVLSHEMGHHFGLLHTFNEKDDYVEDTPSDAISPIEYGTEKDKNRFNIMSYSTLGNKTFTIGQIERMQRYASAWLSEESTTSVTNAIDMKKHFIEIVNILDK
jgi:hypothetical protein